MTWREICVGATRMSNIRHTPVYGNLVRGLAPMQGTGILVLGSSCQLRVECFELLLHSTRVCARGSLVICTVAQLYWTDWRIEKAREWFERAVSVGPDFGDGGVGGSNSSANMGWRHNKRTSLCDVRWWIHVTMRRGNQLSGTGPPYLVQHYP